MRSLQSPCEKRAELLNINAAQEQGLGTERSHGRASPVSQQCPEILTWQQT